MTSFVVKEIQTGKKSSASSLHIERKRAKANEKCLEEKKRKEERKRVFPGDESEN